MAQENHLPHAVETPDFAYLVKPKSALTWPRPPCQSAEAHCKKKQLVLRASSSKPSFRDSHADIIPRGRRVEQDLRTRSPAGAPPVPARIPPIPSRRSKNGNSERRCHGLRSVENELGVR